MARFLVATLLSILLMAGQALGQSTMGSSSAWSPTLTPSIHTDRPGLDSILNIDLTKPLRPDLGDNGGIVRGEWETAGSMEPPYEPPYRYEYLCQIELSDSSWNNNSGSSTGGGHYKIIGVSRFTVDSKPKWIGDFEKLPWAWVKLSGDGEKILPRPPASAPSLVGHWVSVSLAQGSSIANDLVVLNINVALPVGNYLIPRMETVIAKRSDLGFSGAARVEGQRVPQKRNSPPETIGRKLYVECAKRL